MRWLGCRANGQVIVGGSFSTADGTGRSNLARLNTDGTLDSSFSPAVNGTVNAVAVQANGQIVLTGSFSTVAGAAHANVARLNSDGSVDASFTASANGTVTALAVDSAGKLNLGGSFSQVDGQPRVAFARLGTTVGAAQNLTVNSAFNAVTLTRSGGAPELSQVEVQVSTDGSNWSNLAAASRVGTSANWSLTNVALPGNTVFYLRTLGVAPTSQFGSSSLNVLTQEFDSATGFTNGTASALLGAAAAVVAEGPITTNSIRISGLSALGSATNASQAAINADSANARLITFSSCANVTPGNPVVAGFTISGSAPKTVLLRAVGPGLGAFGVSAVIANPYLEVFDSTGQLILANAGWNGDAALDAVFSQVGAFPFLSGSADAAAVAVLAPGAYTVQVGGASGQTGAVLAEVYDADDLSVASTTQIAAVSARGGVDLTNSLIGGFVVSGSSRTILIRGVGPALGTAGALSAPVLSVYDSQGNLVAQNAGWSNPVTVSAAHPAAGAPDLAVAAATAGASALVANSGDSAVLVTLPRAPTPPRSRRATAPPANAAIEVL